MASLNKVQLIGRLGRDPETMFTPSGTKVANFSVAVGRRWRGQTARSKKTPIGSTWWPGDAWRKSARNI